MQKLAPRWLPVLCPFELALSKAGKSGAWAEDGVPAGTLRTASTGGIRCGSQSLKAQQVAPAPAQLNAPHLGSINLKLTDCNLYSAGYGGSPPETHSGRFAAVLMMFLGPLTVSFMTGTSLLLVRHLTILSMHLRLVRHLTSFSMHLRLSLFRNCLRIPFSRFPRVSDLSDRIFGPQRPRLGISLCPQRSREC